MPMRRKSLGTDRESLASLVTVLTPIARRLATDKELRDELRSTADSLLGVYRRTRGDDERRASRGSAGVYAYEERVGGAGAARSPVAAEIVGGGAPSRRAEKGRGLRVGLAAAAAAGATAALLAGRHALRHGGRRRSHGTD